jgi:ureidoacrylate peracid hydrolase
MQSGRIGVLLVNRRHDYLMTHTRSQYRLASLDKSGNGFPLWHELDVQSGDERILKNRFSAFTRGSSNLEVHLRQRALDTLLIAGTATNACCDATARDAMMLNFKTVMVSDALAAHSDDIHAAALRCFYSNFGDVLTAAEVIGGFTVKLPEAS